MLLTYFFSFSENSRFVQVVHFKMHIFRFKVPTKRRRHIEINFQKENNKIQFIAQNMHIHTHLTNVTCVYHANNNLYGYFISCMLSV